MTEGIFFWKARSRSEKCLTIFLTGVLAIAIILATFLSLIHFAKHDSPNKELSSSLPTAEALVSNSSAAADVDATGKNICLTKACVKSAAKLMDNIDESVDPCDDFFDFSCRGFVKRTIIPDEKSSVSSLSLIKDNLEERLKLIIDRPINDSDSRTTFMTKLFYKSCINTTNIESMGINPLLKILKQMGGWPVVDGGAWNAANFSWIDAMFKNKEFGFSSNYIFQLSVSNDYRNSSRRIIWLNQPHFGLDREYLIKGINDSDVEAYLKYAVGVAELLGANRTTAEEEMLEAILFEMELSKISLPREERRNSTKLYNLRTFRDLEVLTPQVPWMDYMNFFLPPSIKIEKDEIIAVQVPRFFKALPELLEKTKNRTLANYIMWRVIADSVDHLSEDIRELKLNFQKTLTGKVKYPPRWKECISLVTDKLPYAVGNLYVKNYFDVASKSKLKILVGYIREEFDRVLSNVGWMDESTRIAAMRKSKSIKEHIGFPEELLMDEKLTEFYQNLKIDEQHLLENVLRIQIFDTNESFRKLREPVDKLDWKLQKSAAQVNAFYSSLENSIKFPAGILQGVIFEPNRPQYMNYGGIGMVIGHEITHGFDDRGKQYNDKGDLQNWWNPETEKNFLEKTNCIIWQYGNYTDPETGIKLNGINTQGENIADCGGVKEAYNSYQKWVKDNGPEPALPGLTYTPNQLFWISMGQISCTKYRQEDLKKQVLTGYHTPWRFRVLGPLRNSVEFSKDWNCPLGSKMNPIDKCEVW